MVVTGQTGFQKQIQCAEVAGVDLSRHDGLQTGYGFSKLAKFVKTPGQLPAKIPPARRLKRIFEPLRKPGQHLPGTRDVAECDAGVGQHQRRLEPAMRTQRRKRRIASSNSASGVNSNSAVPNGGFMPFRSNALKML